MKNVFGLSRSLNQSYDNEALYWTGYTSFDMNIAEEQDDTYSVANCLSKLWQAEIDSGNHLPDLYIVHIAVGAQGVTEGFMWHPDREKVLKPGKTWRVNISLYPFCRHIFSLLPGSLAALGKAPDYIGIHWRGGEEDVSVSNEKFSHIYDIYHRLFFGFYEALGEAVPTILHKMFFRDSCIKHDPSGEYLRKMHCINDLFDSLCESNKNMTAFDVRNAPLYHPDIPGTGLFIEDLVHYTPEVNNWVASQILKEYKEKIAVQQNRQSSVSSAFSS